MFSAFGPTHTKKRLSSHLLVLSQAVFLVLSCYPVGLYNAGSKWWLLLCLAGTILGIVVLTYNTLGNFGVYPEIKQGAHLITDGPYRFVRHPMYAALILMMIGIAGYNGHWLNAVGAVGIVIVVVIKAIREEALLPQVFSDYENYRARTWRFVPFLF